jgi:hypothetical protein
MDEAYLAVIETPVGDSSEVERDYLVSLSLPELEALTLGEQGPPGLPGAPGPAGGSAFQRIAGETLSALRAVYELDGVVRYLDPQDSDHIDLLLGLTLTAATPGAPVNIQRSGPIDDAGWSWIPGPVWLGPAGTLTQTPPADGYDLLIGAAMSATRLTLNIQDPITLE